MVPLSGLISYSSGPAVISLNQDPVPVFPEVRLILFELGSTHGGYTARWACDLGWCG